EGLALIAQLPVTAAVGGDEKLVGQVAEAFPNLPSWLGPATSGKSEYKKTTIHWVRFASNSQFVQMVRGFSDARRAELKLTPTLYHARIDDGFFAGFSEEALRELIDQSVARKEGKGPAKKEMIDVNTSLYLSPQAAFKAKEAFDAYLEWETHKRAWPNNAIWYALHRSQVAGKEPNQSKAQDAARQFLGFIPVSPDGPRYFYAYVARTDECVNGRHGSLRCPTLHAGLSDASPVRGLVEQLKSLRVDLRFREDGVHTIVTIDRQ
ncbi:MAG: hypothetical protein L0099_04430, partial [Acidobacteria bacterium]|nr:hypothetical protein [Acidobacteriota bacterium]